MVGAQGLTSLHSAARALIASGDRDTSVSLSLVVEPFSQGSNPIHTLP